MHARNYGEYDNDNRNNRGGGYADGYCDRYCASHKLEYIYFCKKCESWLCADCGVLEQKHTGH